MTMIFSGETPQNENKNTKVASRGPSPPAEIGIYATIDDIGYINRKIRNPNNVGFCYLKNK